MHLPVLAPTEGYSELIAHLAAKRSDKAMLSSSIANWLKRGRSAYGTAASLLRFAAIKDLQRVKNPAGLAPKGRFIAAETIEREIG